MLVAQPGQDPGCGMALLARRGQVIGEHRVDRRLVRVQARCCADRFLAGWGFGCGECLADGAAVDSVFAGERGWTGHRLARRGGCRRTAALVIPSWLPCPRDWFPVMGTSLKGWGQFRPSTPRQVARGARSGRHNGAEPSCHNHSCLPDVFEWQGAWCARG